MFVFVLPNSGTELFCGLEDDDIELEKGPELTGVLLSDESMFVREGSIGCGLVGREGRRGRRVGRGLIAKVLAAADGELDCFAFKEIVEDEDEGAGSRV